MICKCGGTIIHEPALMDDPDMVLVRCNKCKKPHVFRNDLWEMSK